MEVENRYKQYVQVWVDQFGAHRLRLDPRLKRVFNEARLPGFVANRIFVDVKGSIRIRGGSPSDLASPFMESVLKPARATDLVNASQYLAQAYRDLIREIADKRLVEFLDQHQVTSARKHNALNEGRFIQLVERAPLLAQVIMRSGILADIAPAQLLGKADAYTGAHALNYLRGDKSAPTSKPSIKLATWLQNSSAMSGEQTLRSNQVLLEMASLIERCEVPQILRMKPHHWTFLYRVVAIEPKLGPCLVKNPDTAYKTLQEYLPPEQKRRYRRQPQLLEERVLLDVKAFIRSDDFGLNEASQFSTVVEKAKIWNRQQGVVLQDIEKAEAPHRPRVIYPHFEMNRPIRFEFDGKCFEIIPLLTRDDLVRDGEEMKHCIGDLYDSDARLGDSVLFSIRSRDSAQLRATLETTRGGTLVQLLHFKNALPTDEFEDAVAEAIRPLRMATVTQIQPLAPDFDQLEGLTRGLI